MELFKVAKRILKNQSHLTFTAAKERNLPTASNISLKRRNDYSL